MKNSLEKIVAQEVRIDTKEYMNEILPFDKDEYKNIALIQELRNIYREELEKIESYIRKYLQPIISYPGTPRGDNMDQLEEVKQSYLFFEIRVSKKQEMIDYHNTQTIEFTAQNLNTQRMKSITLNDIKEYFKANIFQKEGKVVYKKQNGEIFEIINDEGGNIQIEILEKARTRAKIYYVSINGENLMVLKYFEKNDGKKIFNGGNIKGLIPEIVPNNEIGGIGVLDRFVDAGQKVGFVLMSCVPILNEKIQEVLTYKERRKYVKGFVKYFLSMMKSRNYIRYVHRDLKPMNLAYEEKGNEVEIKTIDFDDAKVIKGNKTFAEYKGGVTLIYVGKTMNFLSNSIGESKDDFLNALNQRISNPLIQTKFLNEINFLKSIEKGIRENNEYEFEDGSTLIVKNGNVEYFYTIESMVWPQGIRTLLDIILGGNNARNVKFGARN